MNKNKPTKFELEFYNRSVDKLLTFNLTTMNEIRHLISTYEQFFGNNERYQKLEKLFNERMNFLIPNPRVKRVKEITQDEWEESMKDSIMDQLKWEETK